MRKFFFIVFVTQLFLPEEGKHGEGLREKVVKLASKEVHAILLSK